MKKQTEFECGLPIVEATCANETAGEQTATLGRRSYHLWNDEDRVTLSCWGGKIDTVALDANVRSLRDCMIKSETSVLEENMTRVRNLVLEQSMSVWLHEAGRGYPRSAIGTYHSVFHTACGGVVCDGIASKRDDDMTAESDHGDDGDEQWLSHEAVSNLSDEELIEMILEDGDSGEVLTSLAEIESYGLGEKICGGELVSDNFIMPVSAVGSVCRLGHVRHVNANQDVDYARRCRPRGLETSPQTESAEAWMACNADIVVLSNRDRN